MDQEARSNYVVDTERKMYAADSIGRKALVLALAGGLVAGGETGYIMLTQSHDTDQATKVYAVSLAFSFAAVRTSMMARQYKNWRIRKCIDKTGVDPREFQPGLSIFTDSEFQL